MNNEYSRLRAVDRFTQLDASITQDLKDIVDLAAQVCGTPVALVTLLGAEMQWFKASTGVDMTDTPREIALCNHTIEQEELTIVPDTSIDDRFSANPLVASAPFVRFYAGSPLITDDGYAVGSLCVVDFEPKTLNDLQLKTLKVLSKQVMNLMQLNVSLQSLEIHHKQSIQQAMQIADSELKLKAVFDSSNDLHMLIGKHFEILAFNKSAAGYFYNIYKKAPTLGDNILDFIDEDVSWQVTRCLLSAMAGRSLKKELMIRPGTEYAGWREIKFVPIRNGAGEIIGAAITSVDITERKMHQEQIKAQNEALTRIAIIQSHELRRPVASLLGIMELIKLDQAENIKNEQEYLGIMQTTINELDEKIRMIVKDSEETIQSHLSIVA
ncbi:hypothetical protein DJ568_00600 [Mucilaginibacter hurinus]|uniref:histidine kinase n=1 Tax=Mucilaginibacter hurinus TaxID=2201324 RepID=A0A367GUN8_9SPHI|nr:GAF domain-containing protein [Mucilaginibacter hurinus]RCH56393.1 hypothetical protein DJ568_00600 [Mucilaginibacter hurinus]